MKLNCRNAMYLTILFSSIFFIGCGKTENVSCNDFEDILDIEEIEETQENEISVFDSIDWDYFAEKMSPEDKEDFEEYRLVLDNKEKFYCFDWGDSEYYFDEYLTTIESSEQPAIEGVTLVDFDNQNGKELVVYICEGGGNYLILTRDSDKIYGTNLGARFLENVQRDGRYIGVGGAADRYFCRLTIDAGGFESTLFGEAHGETRQDGSLEEILEIDGKRIDEDLDTWLDENYSDPVEWITLED